ncbi:MAG: type II toxin-antitoxin system VapC family toxin [Candidatus Limnocylindrales bacterium]
MTVYADSSAVLAWLLDEPGSERVADALRPPAEVVVSDLTLIECDRSLHRLVRHRPANAAAVARLRLQVAELAASWVVVAIGEPIVTRARDPFPDDAIRTFDAIHLATAMVIRASTIQLDLLSLDERMRLNALALGFRVLPE